MTVYQDPALHADKAIEAVLKKLKGEEVENTIDIPVTTVTEDNVDEVK